MCADCDHSISVNEAHFEPKVQYTVTFKVYANKVPANPADSAEAIRDGMLRALLTRLEGGRYITNIFADTVSYDGVIGYYVRKDSQ